MNKMFIVKYPASVDNENLVSIGTLRIKHYKIDNPNVNTQYFVCSLSSPSQITVSKGLEILSSDLKTSKGTSVIGGTGEAAISNGDGYIDINDKYNLSTLSLGSSYELNLSDIKYSTEITMISLAGTQVTGTLSDLANLTKLSRLNLGGTHITGTLSDLANLTNLTDLSMINDTNVTGTLSDLANLTNLTNFNISGTNVTGTLSDLANLTNLTNFNISGTNVTGTWEDFIKKQRDKGKTSGSIISYWNLGATTLNGTSIRSNTPSGKITISWNSNSITLEGTANDGTFNV